MTLYGYARVSVREPEDLASDAGGLLNSVPGALVGMTPIGEVVVEVEFWIGVGDLLVRRTIQNISVEPSSDISEGGELES